MAINSATLLKDEMDNINVSPEQYFKSQQSWKKYIPKASIENTFEVAKLCNVMVGEGEHFYPDSRSVMNKRILRLPSKNFIIQTS